MLGESGSRREDRLQRFYAELRAVVNLGTILRTTLILYLAASTPPISAAWSVYRAVALLDSQRGCFLTSSRRSAAVRR